jgi:hypothetical protein
VLIGSAIIGLQDLIPIFVFGGVVIGIWSVLNILSERNKHAQERLLRHGRPVSHAEGGDARLTKKPERFQAVQEMA